MRKFFVYILASRKNGTLYTGVTSNLPRRAWEHRASLNEGFTNPNWFDLYRRFNW